MKRFFDISKKDVYKDRINFVLNSIFCFITAFMVVKGIIGLSRFVIMRHFSAWVHLVNFDLICMNGKDARIWTETSVISMYSVGFIVASALAIIGIIVYYKIKKTKGLLKLFTFWFYVIALNQSLGVFLRDIPIKRDLYHALNWMYVPYEFMIGLTVLSGIILFVLNGFNHRKALRVATSTEQIRDNKSRRKTYALIVVLPALISSIFLFFLHFYNMKVYGAIEFLILIISLLVPYAMFFRGEIPKKIKIFKEENTAKINSFFLTTSVLALIGYVFVKIVFF